MIGRSKPMYMRSRARRMGHNPVYWKECIESVLSSPSSRVKALFFVLVPFLFLYILSLMGWEELWYSRDRFRGFRSDTLVFHTLFIIGELAIAFFYVIGASANAFSKERSKKTLESLLSTQLESHVIWSGKFLGVCRKASALLMIPILHFTLMMFHDIVPFSVPAVILPVTLVLLAFFTSVGIGFSVKFTSRISSIIGTLVVAFFIFIIVPAFAGFIATLLSFGPSGAEESVETIISLSPWYWIVVPLQDPELGEYWGFGIGYVWFLIIYGIMAAIISYSTAKPLRERLAGAD